MNLFKKLLRTKKFASFNKYLSNETGRKLHEPVMLNEVLKYLVEDVRDFNVYLDMTFGAGSHSEAILNKNPNSTIFALDRDPFAFKLAQQLNQKYPGRVIALNGRFSQVGSLLSERGVKEGSIDAALIDCGVSSIQFDTAERGFSISKDGPLDMRMASDKENDTIKASDVVNRLDEKSLSKIIWKYGEERMHRKIAHGIVYFRNAHGKIETTKQLADIISATVTESRVDSLNRPTSVATKTFQALRIFVNNELNELYNGLTQVHKHLRPGGRLAVISFHSLEDRIVKGRLNDVELDLFKDEEEESLKHRRNSDLKFKMKSSPDLETFMSTVKKPWSPLNKKVIEPSEMEIATNPRSRSAKLRIAIKN